MSCEEGSRRRRHHPPSPAVAPPLDDDDLLAEILLRLPPQPSSLPRASAVCKRWHGLVSDAGFFRRFRTHHRRNPPLLGLFHRHDGGCFTPTPGSPNLVPPWRVSVQPNTAAAFFPPVTLGCHHGLVLFYIPTRVRVRVWDPVTGEQHDIALPPRFSPSRTNIALINGAVLRAAAGDAHFQVVLLTADDDGNHTRAFTCVYSSETGVWGDLISTPITWRTRICTRKAAVRVGDSFYWLLGRLFFSGDGILQFDLDRQRLAVIQAPVDNYLDYQVTITRAECGGLGFLFLSRFRVQLWNRNKDCNGAAASWMLGRTVQLDKLLPLTLEEKKGIPSVTGFAEYNNVVFIETISWVFMINFKSSQFKKLSGTGFMGCYPFESVYAAGT